MLPLVGVADGRGVFVGPCVGAGVRVNVAAGGVNVFVGVCGNGVRLGVAVGPGVFVGTGGPVGAGVG